MEETDPNNNENLNSNSPLSPQVTEENPNLSENINTQNIPNSTEIENTQENNDLNNLNNSEQNPNQNLYEENTTLKNELPNETENIKDNDNDNDNEIEQEQEQNENLIDQEKQENDEEKEENKDEEINEEENKEENKEENLNEENNNDIKEENEIENYTENINKIPPKNKRLPKINSPKSLTENSINPITTNATEIKKENSQITLMRNKVLNFHTPKIRNNYYNNLQSIDTTFLQRKKEFQSKDKLPNLIDFENDILSQIEKIKNPFKLTDTETKKYLDIYDCDEIRENIQDLKSTHQNKIYKSMEFNTTRISEMKAFKIFYSKMRKDTEIIRKGGINLITPSFNFIRATRKFNAVPNPVGIIKRRGEINKLYMNNKLCGDNYVKCLCEALKISEHINQINLKKNRLSDLSIIQLFNTILKNNILLKQLNFIDLSFNKLSFAGTEIICQYLLDYNCNLEHFNLESNNLGNNNSKKIINAIHQNLDIKIKYINLGQNILNDEIAPEIALLINKCHYLNVLILYQNQFMNQGAGLIMSEIKSHPSLKILDLSWNLIGTNLTDEIPTLDELIKASSKQETKKNFDNAYLNELKYTMQFRRPGTLSPVRIGSKVSYFTSQLCELFHNKSTELVHLDISYNNINTVDAKAISEHIKDNHTILGIHVDGNDMWVDELGFVYPIEKSSFEYY